MCGLAGVRRCAAPRQLCPESDRFGVGMGQALPGLRLRHRPEKGTSPKGPDAPRRAREGGQRARQQFQRRFLAAAGRYMTPSVITLSAMPFGGVRLSRKVHDKAVVRTLTSSMPLSRRVQNLQQDVRQPPEVVDLFDVHSGGLQALPLPVHEAVIEVVPALDLEDWEALEDKRVDHALHHRHAPDAEGLPRPECVRPQALWAQDEAARHHVLHVDFGRHPLVRPIDFDDAAGLQVMQQLLAELGPCGRGPDGELRKNLLLQRGLGQLLPPLRKELERQGLQPQGDDTDLQAGEIF